MKMIKVKQHNCVGSMRWFKGGLAYSARAVRLRTWSMQASVKIVLTLLCSQSFGAHALSDTSVDYAAVVADQSRLEEQVKRDLDRKPAEVMALAEVRAGHKIAEIAPGGGYYTALLSRAVGEEGTIYAVDPERIFVQFPQAKEGFPKYIAADARENVEYSVQRLDEFQVGEKLDSIFMVLYYHDTLWTGEDRAKMNAAFFAALKPGGMLFILDHNAKPGSDAQVAQSLHRMDKNQIFPEVTKAGFGLVAEHDLLNNPEDPLDVSVFDEQWRGKTDRFIYVFRKPESFYRRTSPD